MRTVSPCEGNFSVLERNQAMVGNGHSMGVAAEIFENLLTPAEWGFAVNHPIVAVKVADEGMKGLRIRKMLQLTVKPDFPFSKSLFQGIYNLSSKNFPEYPLRQKTGSVDPPAPSADDQTIIHRQELRSEHADDALIAESNYEAR